MSTDNESAASESREPARSNASGKKIIFFLAVLLAVLHQDTWFWHSETLVLGFMPIGLAYHALYSILAAGIWLLACKIAWPHELERFANEVDEKDGAGGADGV